MRAFRLGRAGCGLVFAWAVAGCGSTDREEIVESSHQLMTCTKTSTGSGAWDSSGTWAPAGAPAAGAVVCVGPSHVVTVSSNPLQVAQLQISGTLRFDPNASVALSSTGNIVVFDHGRLQMKPASHAQKHTIEFAGVDEQAYVGATMAPVDSDVGLWVLDHGVLEAEGSAKKSWTKATANIAQGATTIAVADTTDWQVDDLLVITPTQPPDGTDLPSSYYSQFESRIVASKTPTSVTFVNPTQYAHPLVNGEWGAEVLNLTRNVKISGTCTLNGAPITCNTDNAALVKRRAHIMFSHVEETQTLKHLELFNLGPRKKLADGKTVTIQGRYGLHFHMTMATGHLVDGVAMHEIGSHAFVPHASHGMTIKNSISYNTWDAPFWYDRALTVPERAVNDTNDLLLDGNVAAWVNADPFHSARLSAFVLGGGQRNILRNSVAVGVRGGATSSGFEWLENRIDSAWTFQDNVAHNNRIDGIFTWQNWADKTPLHVVENSTVYHNGQSGIEHGAYGNGYVYRNMNVYGNRGSGVRIHAGSIPEHFGTLTFEGLTIDGAGITISGFQIGHHNSQVGLAGSTLIKNNLVKNLHPQVGKAVQWEYAGPALHLGDNGVDLDRDHVLTQREWFRFVDNEFIPPQPADTFHLTGFTGVDGKPYGLSPLSDIFVSTPDGERYTLRALSFENPFTEGFEAPSADYGVNGQTALNGKWYKGWAYSRVSGDPQTPTRESNDTGKVSGVATGSGLLHRKTVEAPNVSQSVLATVSHASSVAGLFARSMAGDERRTYYLADVGIAGSTHPLSIWRVVDGVPTLLASQPSYLSSGVAQTLELTVGKTATGTSLAARLGANAVLSFTDTDERLRDRAGRFGIAVTSGPGSQAVTFDDYTSTIDPASIAQDRFNAKIQQWAAPGTPIVDAGANTMARLPAATVALHGSARDGGVLNPGGLTYSWTVVGGPSGGATVQNPAARETYASFSAAGLYVLRLTVSDGTLTSSDDLQVMVDPAQADNVVDEQFTGANNSPWPATWTLVAHGSPATYISGGSGVVHALNPAYAWLHNNEHNAQNVDITATIQLSANAAYGGLFARKADSEPDTYLVARYGYVSSAVSGTEDLRITAVVDGVEMHLAELSVAPNLGEDPQKLRFLVESKADGTMDLRVKVWPASASQPSAWTLERLGYANPIFQGRTGRFGAQARTTVTNRWVAFDAIHADILDAPAATIITESWTGSNGAAWSSQWSGTPVAGTNVSIQSNEGQVSAPSAYGGALKYINSHQALSVDLVSTIRLNPNNARGGLVALHNPGTDAHVGFKFGATSFDMDAARIYWYANGTLTDLAKVTSTFAHSNDYKVRLNVEVLSPTSVNLRAKVCLLSNCPDDGTWTVQKLAWSPPAAISAATPGRFGVFAEEGQAGRTTTFDNFQATFLP